MSQTSVTSQSTWRSKIKAMGPGILMASAAVGGSHIVSSTQAGGSYGWALLGLVILANLFKYPFFRFGAEYTADTGKTLVEGYAEKGKFYLWVFFILNVFSALVNTAGVSILCSAIIASAFPMLGLSITTWSIILVAIIWGMLLFGGYKLLDGMAKWIMSALTIATVAAVIIAAIKHPEYSADFVEKTPWQLAALPFIVSLLGWMPAPIEISAINSLWSAEKKKTVDFNTDDALFDFNVGYIGTAILAVFFVALGALIQYPTGKPVEAASAKYIAQFVGMYASVLGEWSRYLITFIAFLCIFGTVITVIDGYSRVNEISLRLLFNQKRKKSNTFEYLDDLDSYSWSHHYFLLPRSSSNHASFRHDWFIPYNTFLCAFELRTCYKREERPSNLVERTCYCRFDLLVRICSLLYLGFGYW